MPQDLQIHWFPDTQRSLPPILPRSPRVWGCHASRVSSKGLARKHALGDAFPGSEMTSAKMARQTHDVLCG